MSRKTISAETREKLRVSSKRLHAGPSCPIGMYGRKHSEETKAKISLSMTGKKKSPDHVQKMAEIFRGDGSKRWKGGEHKKDGYVLTWVGSHRYIKRCRIIAQKAIGRELKTSECVHHINGNRSDDRKENLLVCMNSYHQVLHQRMKKCADKNKLQEVSL